MNVLKNKNNTKVIGSFNSYYLILISHFGSIDDSFKYYGLAHLCEHYMLLSVQKYLSKDILMFGYTEFDHILCLYRTSNILDLKNIIKYIKSKEYFKVDKDILRIAKNEVLIELNNDYYEKEAVFSFITNKYIDHLPVGNLSILDVDEEAIQKCLINYYNDCQHLYIGNIDINSIPTCSFCKKDYKSLFKIQYDKNSVLDISENQKNKRLYIFFVKPECNQLEWFILKFIFNNIPFYSKYKSIQVFDKIIDEHNQLIYLHLEINRAYKIKEIENIVDYIASYPFREKKIISVKETIKNSLRVLNENDFYIILESLKKELLYQEVSVITEMDIDFIKKAIDQIDYHCLNNLKYDIFTENYRIVIK